jgi:hypothetical protein
VAAAALSYSCNDAVCAQKQAISEEWPASSMFLPAMDRSLSACPLENNFNASTTSW